MHPQRRRPVLDRHEQPAAGAAISLIASDEVAVSVIAPSARSSEFSLVNPLFWKKNSCSLTPVKRIRLAPT
jgi:hypothetical protein